MAPSSPTARCDISVGTSERVATATHHVRDPRAYSTVTTSTAKPGSGRCARATITTHYWRRCAQCFRVQLCGVGQVVSFLRSTRSPRTAEQIARALYTATPEERIAQVEGCQSRLAVSLTHSHPPTTRREATSNGYWSACEGHGVRLPATLIGLVACCLQLKLFREGKCRCWQSSTTGMWAMAELSCPAHVLIISTPLSDVLNVKRCRGQLPSANILP